jgi:uncharacterized protein YfaT (DUF1175 family)
MPIATSVISGPELLINKTGAVNISTTGLADCPSDPAIQRWAHGHFPMNNHRIASRQFSHMRSLSKTSASAKKKQIKRLFQPQLHHLMDIPGSVFVFHFQRVGRTGMLMRSDCVRANGLLERWKDPPRVPSICLVRHSPA